MDKEITKKTQSGTKTPSKAKRPQRPPQSASPAAAESRIEPNLDAIRKRAYEIYSSGRNQGDPVADWSQAERELRDTSA